MKKIIVALIALTISISAFSQSYKQAVGIKLGYDVEFTYKYNLSQINAIDAGLGWFFDNSFLVNGFYLWNFDINQVDGLRWYVGPGAYLGAYLHKEYSSIMFSINARAGIEYKFDDIPLALSLDWSPGIEFSGKGDDFGPDFGWRGLGLGVKYTF